MEETDEATKVFVFFSVVEEVNKLDDKKSRVAIKHRQGH